MALNAEAVQQEETIIAADTLLITGTGLAVIWTADAGVAIIKQCITNIFIYIISKYIYIKYNMQ